MKTIANCGLRIADRERGRTHVGGGAPASRRPDRGRPARIVVLTAALTCTFLVLLVACGKEKAVTSPDVVAMETSALPTSPDDPAWSKVPVHVANLLLQDMVDPRLMEPSTQRVRVRALTDGTTIAFQISWDDATKDDLPGPGRFPDGCAVQLPREASADLPAPQMGEAGRVVEIAYWRASWQAVVDGRGDTINDIHPQASVDHYPFEAASLDKDPVAKQEMATRYAPARALGNDMAGPRTNPVEALIAQGPGTLTPDETTVVDGGGRYGNGSWAVVITRPMPAGLQSSDHSQVAFAVWQGSHDEAGARKMRTGWVALVRRSDG